MFPVTWHVTADQLDPYGLSNLWTVSFIIEAALPQGSHFCTIFSVEVNQVWTEEQAIEQAFRLLDQTNLILPED